MVSPNRTKDIESFDRLSGTYEQALMQRWLFDPAQRAVLEAIPCKTGSVTILDIGCGTGRLLRKAAARWPAARLIGVDPAEGMIAQARRLAPFALFYPGQAETLPLPDESVDVALSTLSFHHWADQEKGLRQVARVLRPGGCFVLADALMPLGLAKVFRHGRQLEAPLVRQIFARAGLAALDQRRMLGGFVLITVGEKR